MAARHDRLDDWVRQPAPFNVWKCGRRVQFSQDYSVAERVEPEGSKLNGIAYTALPVAVGEIWRITVLATTESWQLKGGLSVGLVLQLPIEVPSGLFGHMAGPSEWICDGQFIHNGKLKRKILDLHCLDTLAVGQSVGLQVSPEGELNLYLDKEPYYAIATGLPVDKPLCGVADVYGWCTKIKSEMMSAPRYKYPVKELQVGDVERQTSLDSTNGGSHSGGQRSEKGMKVPLIKDLLADVKTPEWYRLGLELTNDETSMNLIQKDCGHCTQDALKAVFNHWLITTEEPSPSWWGMVDALRQIQENKLAQAIEKKYCLMYKM